MHVEERDGLKIFVIHDFFSPEECAAAIAHTEVIGYGDAPITTGSGPVINKSVRNNERVMHDDTELAVKLWERGKPFLQVPVRHWEPIGLNERFRYYRYDVGQRFDQHFDGFFRRTDDEVSYLTFMIYLNDDFQGGDTIFYTGWRTWCAEHLRVKPVRGSALVFVHQQLHEGGIVTFGRKYVLRTDVMYRRNADAMEQRYPGEEKDTGF